jgi:hypothetical protein
MRPHLSNKLSCCDGDILAAGRLERGGTLSVLRGSTARGDQGVTTRRLLRAGDAREVRGKVEFLRDVSFRDPSAAACYVVGRAELDGWTSWCDAQGRTLHELWKLDRTFRPPQERSTPPRSARPRPPLVSAPVMEFIPELRQVMICDVCGQEISATHREQTMKDVALFGATNFGVCCCCLQGVPESLAESSAYQTRWIDYRHRARVAPA